MFGFCPTSEKIILVNFVLRFVFKELLSWKYNKENQQRKQKNIQGLETTNGQGTYFNIPNLWGSKETNIQCIKYNYNSFRALHLFNFALGKENMRQQGDQNGDTKAAPAADKKSTSG